ncbi:hypothetical protein SAMN05421882_103925 [Nitrosomonas communis]|uniref:Uncharacterized protein n=1 Tax=Nitrosomonas communis TaxID=44574 RepID=A0A1H2XJ81_9PROT|nr:hypothetical protein SAMN05421882_103925 [Nitrosomonas communis]
MSLLMVLKNVCRNGVARLEPVAYVFTLDNILAIFNYVRNRLLGFSSVALRGFPDLSGAARRPEVANSCSVKRALPARCAIRFFYSP